MPGFDTGSVMYALNVDFTGNSLTSGTPQVLQDGQLLIGSTATPNIRVGKLTSSDGSIVVTNGSGTINLAANGGLPYISLSPYIVGTDVHSGYSTISSAVTAAISGGATASNPQNVYIKVPANGAAYTENVTLQPGVNLVGFGGTPTITGKLSYTSVGTVRISGLTLQTNSDYLLAVTGSSASTVFLKNCNIDCLNNTGISFTSSSASSSIQLDNCFGSIDTTGITLFTSSSAGALTINNMRLSNAGSTTASTTSSGAVNLYYSLLPIPFSTSSTGTFIIEHCEIQNLSTNSICLTTAGTGASIIYNSILISGTASCLSIGAGTTITITNSTAISNNTNVFTGSGTLDYGLIVFIGTSSGHNVTTENALATLI
jgi:hypothetical protein